jgi:hypothetical protein
VRVGQATLGVAGSNGIDQSMDYTLHLNVPRSELGADANRAIAGLIARAGKTGIDLQAAEAVALDIKLGGTLTNPTVQTNLGDVVASVGEKREAGGAEGARRASGLRETARRLGS